MSNLVPNGWEATDIGELTKTKSLFKDGDWVESKDQDPLGNNRLIQLADIGDGRFIDKSSRFMNDKQFARLKCTELQKGDVLVARMPEPLGRACIYPLENVKAATIVDIAIIRTKNADHYWLMSAINSSEFRYNIDLNASGTTRTRIARGALAKLKLIVPPLPEQQKIAKILTSVDEVIEKTQAQIDKLKDLKTGMMQELLTSGIGHTEFKDSPVGRIPFDWDVVTIDGCNVKVLDGDRGKEYPKEKDFLEHGYCLFLSAKNVTKSGFSFDRRVYLTKEKDELLRKGKLKRDDLVITTRGTLGNIAYFDEKTPYEHIRINSGMAIIRNESTKVTTPYLHLLLNSPVIIEQTELLAFGSAIPQLTIALLKNLHLPIPSKDEQLVIVDTIQAVSSKISLLNRKLVAIKDTKKALMQDLLTGKVRVNTESTNTEVAVS